MAKAPLLVAPTGGHKLKKPTNLRKASAFPVSTAPITPPLNIHALYALTLISLGSGPPPLTRLEGETGNHHHLATTNLLHHITPTTETAGRLLCKKAEDDQLKLDRIVQSEFAAENPSKIPILMSKDAISL